MSKEFYPFMLSNNTVTVVLNNKQYTYTKTQPFFDELKELLSAPKDSIIWDRVIEIIDAEKHLINYSGNNLTVSDGRFFYKLKNGKSLELAENAIITRILDMHSKKEPFTKMLKFLDNLTNNPDVTAINELYLFLEDCDLPITDDGCFLAYKAINKNYTDYHSGKISNKVGTIVTMDRKYVNNDREITCSTGLHFCAKGYLNCFGDSDKIIIAVKVNPADVVSIPSDYNNMKGRCCAYMVVGELDDKLDLKPFADGHEPEELFYTTNEESNKIKIVDPSLENPLVNKDKLPEFSHDIVEETINTDEKKVNLPEDFASENNPYVGSVKGFLKDVKRDDRLLDRDYYLSTVKGVSMYKFIKTIGDKAFTLIKHISDAIKGKKEVVDDIMEEPVKEEVVNNEVLFDDGKLKVERESNDGCFIITGTVKDFLRKFPKNLREADVDLIFNNSMGTKTYRFNEKTTERCFKQIG